MALSSNNNTYIRHNNQRIQDPYAKLEKHLDKKFG